MKPKINNMNSWRQAEVLMQPAFIRILDWLQKKLENSMWKSSYQEVEKPIPGYQLNLEHEDQKVSIDIWELCYQVCFSNYRPTHTAEQTVEVDIDTSLLNENGDVNWDKLDEKALLIVENLMANLPQIQ